jgi:hypothetical protein
MLRFIGDATNQRANQRNILRIVMIVVGENRLEHRSFLEAVADRMRSSGQQTAVYDRTPMPFEFDLDDPRVAVFAQGDQISEIIQDRLLELQRSTLVLAVVNERAFAPAKQGLWDEEFRRNVVATLEWPHWSARKPDHPELLRCMHSGLRMPAGRSVPELDKSADDYLLSQPFTGTDVVDTELKRGLTNYIKSSSTGPLTVSHFVGSQKQRVLTDMRRDVRHPSEPPQAG